MAKLVYSAITSLDGYVNDESGNFGWAAPSEQVHGFINDIERSVGTHLYGRRMYEVMRGWESEYGGAAGDPAVAQDFAEIWRAVDKLVFSTTLDDVTTPRTRLLREFDPAVIRQLMTAAERDISVGGATLAASALRAGLVDEVHLTLCPVIVGGGTRALPAHLNVSLTTIGVTRFDNGVVHLHYRCSNP
jgi:dihydrofolate reductase